MAPPPEVAVVIPAHNEAKNLEFLIPELMEIFGSENCPTVIVVDDGSQDSSRAVLDSLGRRYENLVVIWLGERRGKAAALSEGLKHALLLDVGIVCTMDGDCQDNPAFLPLLIQKAAAGFDLVTARRVNRAEKIPKRVSSKIYNRLVRLFFDTPGRDHNSGMKALSSGLARFLLPYLQGDMHRHISVLAHWGGYPISELPVVNRDRREGVSKYGISRLWFGIEELVMVRFLLWRIDRSAQGAIYPWLGALSGSLSLVIFFATLAPAENALSNLDYLIGIASAFVMFIAAGIVVAAYRSGIFFSRLKESRNSELNR